MLEAGLVSYAPVMTRRMLLARALRAVEVGLEVHPSLLLERRASFGIEEELKSGRDPVSPLVVEGRPHQVHRHAGHRQERRAQDRPESRAADFAVSGSGKAVYL